METSTKCVVKIEHGFAQVAAEAAEIAAAVLQGKAERRSSHESETTPKCIAGDNQLLIPDGAGTHIGDFCTFALFRSHFQTS